MSHSPSLREWITALILLAAGLGVAAVARLVIRQLVRRSSTQPGNGGHVGRLLVDLVPAAALVIGLWLASGQLPLRRAVRSGVDHVLVGVVIVVATLSVANLLVTLTRAFGERRSGIAPSTTIFANIVRIVAVSMGLLLLLESFGVTITPLLTALGVGGLAVALALQDTLTNLFAGIHLLASKKIEPGNYIEMSTGQAGYVVDVNWRNTTVRALLDNMLIIPNAKLSSDVVINYHRPFQPMNVLVQVGVSYDSDLQHVEDVTLAVAREVLEQVDGAVREHQPTVRFHTFADSSINFSVNLRVHEFTSQYAVTSEFIKRLHRRYGTEGIEIPFPIRTVITKAA